MLTSESLWPKGWHSWSDTFQPSRPRPACERPLPERPSLNRPRSHLRMTKPISVGRRVRSKSRGSGDRFCPTFLRADFNAYFLEDHAAAPGAAFEKMETIFASSSPPSYARQTVISAADMLKALGHTGFDRFLLELDLPDQSVGKGNGLMARATSLLSSSLIWEHSSGVFERGFLERGNNFPGVILQLAHRRSNLALEAVPAGDGHAADSVRF
jgi:hypothetical protein